MHDGLLAERLHIIPGIGGRKIDKLSVREVQTFFNKLAKTCQCCEQGRDFARPQAKRRCCAVGKCCEALLLPRSVKGVRGVLRSALSSAKADELVGRNVAELIQIAPVRKRSGKSLAWTSEEARKFLESARTDGHGLYAAFVLVLILGLRKGEVLGLTWDDVNLDARELSIEWQLQRVKGQLLHRETKTEESEAVIPMPDICVAVLRRHRALQDEARKAAGEKWHDSGLVFTTKYGTPIEPRNFNRTWDVRCGAATVRRITIHDARRTCASLLVDLDVHPRIAMQILRHADFSITMEVYTQVSDAQTRAALKRLADSLEGDKSATESPKDGGEKGAEPEGESPAA